MKVTMTQPTNKQAAIDKALRAKIAAMSPAQRTARVREIYAIPRTAENGLEWIKLMFGEDMSIGEVEGAATVATYLSGTSPRGPRPCGQKAGIKVPKLTEELRAELDSLAAMPEEDIAFTDIREVTDFCASKTHL
jgi:hypothetical protein